MANSRRRCRHCRDYFPADQIRAGFCGRDCQAAHRVKPKKSPRLTAFDSEFAAARLQVAERSGGRCEARLACCVGRASHVHHRVLRGQGGGNELENLLHCCDRCHGEIHADVQGSYEAGFLRHSWDVTELD